MPRLRALLKSPPLAKGDAEQQLEELRDYLLQIVEELGYLLTHIEADNINDTTFERISQMIPKAFTGTPTMDGEGSPGTAPTWARGDHTHPKDSSKADVTALAAHIADRLNPHAVTKAQVGLGNVADERQYSAQNPPPVPSAEDVGAIPAAEKGSAGGVAELDANGMVPSAQLPSYVDDVLEYASLSAFPATGESGKIYVALDTGRTYRWSGSAYVEISESLALGETSSTAYRGDRGKTAYDHSQVTSGNPHNVTAAEVGLGNVANERQYSALNPPPLPTPADIGAATAQNLTDHVGDTNNPHSVTAAQVGLDQVANERQYSASNPPPVPDAEDIPYDNTTSGLMATDVQAAIDEIAQGGGGGGTAASAVSYDNTGSGLASTNVQDAIDEVYGDIPAQASDIGAQDAITASGILKGDGQGGVSAASPGTDYQVPLTIDATPTANSTNPVQSGGVYTDVRTRVPVYGMGKNLLDNAYFPNPVNQRGQTSYSGAVYGIDRWKSAVGYTIADVISDGYRVKSSNGSNTAITEQTLENPSQLLGKTVSLTILLSSGAYSYSATVPSSFTNTTIINGANVQLVMTSGGVIVVRLTTNSSAGVVFVSVKLELGTEQTLAHQENGDWVLNEIPDYEYELYRCMTSTADPSDTYANKTLATEQQLAYVESGTTASRNYSVGEYFCWNGLLYRVKTAISSGGTFTPGTNCVQLPEGGLNAIPFKYEWYGTGGSANTVTLSLPVEAFLLIVKGTGTGNYACYYGIAIDASQSFLSTLQAQGSGYTVSLSSRTLAISLPTYARATIIHMPFV